MAIEKLNKVLKDNVSELEERGTAKGAEMVLTGVKQAEGQYGPRFFVEGYGDKEFLKMNANSYLGLSLREDMIEAEENAAKEFGVGPGAVRFISGTYKPHIELEKRLADFHGKEAGMIFSSAYVTSMGVLAPLINKETFVISDELNHNCIINAIRLSRPAGKDIYKHNDTEDLKRAINDAEGKAKRVIVVTDGIFSMRGDHAPLDRIVDICSEHDSDFEEGITTVVDDSHGVGAFGDTGRGTEEY
ncbi:MAG: aminotransferase class I/II-fold pyridoxal phosphate-dependent enzyme, partial [candidate division WOR-3 bacterium]|nr:aminotransferase class I/II-fold pyridoxal phosphate-dependent enzyme [candidate division WOR-3 bacterium]